MTFEIINFDENQSKKFKKWFYLLFKTTFTQKFEIFSNYFHGKIKEFILSAEPPINCFIIIGIKWPVALFSQCSFSCVWRNLEFNQAKKTTAAIKCGYYSWNMLILPEKWQLTNENTTIIHVLFKTICMVCKQKYFCQKYAEL